MGGANCCQGLNNTTIMYSQEVRKEKNEGETPVYRSIEFKDKELTSTLGTLQTMQDIALNIQKLYPNEFFLFSRDKTTNQYVGKTYKEVFELSKNLAKGVLGLKLTQKEEWMIIEVGCVYLYGMTIIPLYDTLGPESIEHCLQNSGVQCMFASSQSIDTFLKTNNLHKLKYIIALDELTQEQNQKIQQNKNLKLFTFQEVIKIGVQVEQSTLPKVTPTTVATFSYTSGTTGVPKAAMLDHKNFVSMAATLENGDIQFKKDDCHLSYLPLPHLYERFLVVGLFSVGAKIYFYSGDVLKLKDDIKDVRPTVFFSVPRLYLRFYTEIKKKFDSLTGVQKFLADKAIAAKLENFQQKVEYTHKFYDSLLFNKVREIFGGRIRLMGTGSAPIAGEILNFLRIVFCCPLIEGYGQTESSAGSFFIKKIDSTTGHVGAPSSNIEFKLVDIPDMNYLSTDTINGLAQPRGEICLKGTGVFRGYYKDQENTRSAIDKDGWLHTGDVGEVIGEGNALRIIDRKKNIFKLSQGEYVAPEKIENVYKQVTGVAEVFVYGNSLQAYLVAVVVPDKDYVLKLGQEKNLSQQSFEQLCNQKEINDGILKNMTDFGKKAKLFGFEQVKKIKLEPVSLMVHGCLTNTFKLQRFQATQLFKADLEKFYLEKDE